MSITLKWGLITGMVYVIYLLGSTMLGLSENGMGAGMLGGLFITVATFIPIFFGVKEIRDEERNGYLTLSQGFISGLKIALIAAVINALFMALYMTVINPGFIDMILAKTEEQWVEMNMSDEQIEQSKKWTGYFMNPVFFTATSLVVTIMMGMVKGLVSGLILKKDPPISMPPMSPPPLSTPSMP
jgi:uncharacterized membrane protein YhaH (DUF805 family)